jgi:hypothetical protein
MESVSKKSKKVLVVAVGLMLPLLFGQFALADATQDLAEAELRAAIEEVKLKLAILDVRVGLKEAERAVLARVRAASEEAITAIDQD